MRDFRPIINILGLLLCIESIALLVPMFFDLMSNNQDWKQFFYISCITFLIGLVLYVGFKKENIKINLRQAFLLTILSWLLIALFGSLPFVYSSSSLNFTSLKFWKSTSPRTAHCVTGLVALLKQFTKLSPPRQELILNQHKVHGGAQ